MIQNCITGLNTVSNFWHKINNEIRFSISAAIIFKITKNYKTPF